MKYIISCIIPAFIAITFLISPGMLMAQSTPAEDHGAGGLVPCNGIDCDFDDLVVLINRVIEKIFIFAPLVATAMIAYAGWLYLTSGGNPGKVSTAHKIFKRTALGLIIILCAFLIVKTLLNNLIQNEKFWTFFE